jgi:hypothetical protein
MADLTAAGIGAGANLVGGILQSVAASRAGQEMLQAMAREMQRQQEYRNLAFGTFQPALQGRGVETARQQIQEGADQRQGYFQQVGQSKLGVHQDSTARGRAQYKLSGQNRANLGGYSDWAIKQMIANIRAQDELNRLSSFAGGTAQVFPYRMYDAQHSQDALALVGGLISSIGGSAPAWSQFGGQAPTGSVFGTKQMFDAPQGFGQNFGNYA